MRDPGRFIRRRRLELGLRQADVAQGLCAPNTLSRIEKGDQIPSAFVFMHILERLGVSGFSYGDFFDGSCSEELSLKYRIIAGLEERRLKPIPDLLGAYSDRFLQSGTEMSEQFFSIARALLFYFEGGDGSLLSAEARKALLLTRRSFDRELFGRRSRLFEDSFLTQSELSCANAIAVGFAKAGNPRDAIVILNRLILSVSSSECCLPVYAKNMAVLFNNAAICEEALFPSESRGHIAEALRVAGRGAGAAAMTRILKNNALINEDGRSRVLYQLMAAQYRISKDVFGSDRFLYVF